MPVRKIPPNGRSLTGRVARPLDEESAEFESSLERDLYSLLVFDKRRYASFEVQPVRIPFINDEGRVRTYTPDVLIHFTADPTTGYCPRPVLGEVKYREDLFKNWKELKPKFKAARAFSREQGWQQFRIFTEIEIRTQYLENAKFLRGFTRTELVPDDASLLLNTLTTLHATTPESLLSICCGDQRRRLELMPTLWQLIALNQIGCNLDEPLTMVSPIWSLAPPAINREDNT